MKRALGLLSRGPCTVRTAHHSLRCFSTTNVTTAGKIAPPVTPLSLLPKGDELSQKSNPFPFDVPRANYPFNHKVFRVGNRDLRIAQERLALIPPNTDDHLILLHQLANAGRYKHALAVLKMTRRTATIQHYNAVLNACKRAKRTKELLLLMDAMRSAWIVPNHVSYCIAIKACQVGGKLGRARDLFEEFGMMHGGAKDRDFWKQPFDQFGIEMEDDSTVYIPEGLSEEEKAELAAPSS
mmetsp:Transcript_6951/g.15961  ORF Transcript_6951/g.15961 Transcript_6951/m.15961 type:complete len:239 (+) Transcript_6951:14-730(+)